VNGFAGTVNLICASNSCGPSPCNILVTPITLTAGEITNITAGGSCYPPGNGNPAGPNRQTITCYILIAGTSPAAPSGYVSQAQWEYSDYNTYC
jgi:hypothetical protein